MTFHNDISQFASSVVACMRSSRPKQMWQALLLYLILL